MKSGQKLLITGGAGYIGNELIKIVPKGIEIIVIDNFHIDTEHKRHVNDKLRKNRKLTLIDSNVSESHKYKELLEDIRIVVYMASLNSYRESNADPLMYLKENSTNLQIFLNTLGQYSPNIEKFILTSTRGVYGEGSYICNSCNNRFYPPLAEELKCTICSSLNVYPQKIKETDMTNPSSLYGITKKLQEDLLSMYCSENDIQLDIFRIFNVYGEDQGKYYSNIGIVPQIYEQIIKQGEMYLSGNGNITRDFVYVADVNSIILKSIFLKNKRRNNKEIYNLGSGQPISINDIAKVFETLGYSFKKNRLKNYEDIKYSVADNSKVIKDFNIKDFKSMFDFLANTYKKI